jgi:hypothetical protein
LRGRKALIGLAKGAFSGHYVANLFSGAGIMKRIMAKVMLLGVVWCGLAAGTVFAEQAHIRLDNFWSDGPVSVFLYAEPHTRLDPEGYFARHDLTPGEAKEVSIGERRQVWADVRIMHSENGRWVLCSESCGYRRAFAVQAGQTIVVSYDNSRGYGDSRTALECSVEDGRPAVK